MTAVRDVADVPRTAWRNGAGWTRELGAGTAASSTKAVSWRLSLADITGPCSFSIFPGMWRWSTVLAGPPLRLRLGPGHERTVARGVVDYSGEWHVTARPVDDTDGPAAAVEVLNLMVTTGGAGRLERVAVAPGAELPLSPDTVAVVVVRGQVTLGGTRLGAGCLATDARPGALAAVAAPASCVVVGVNP
ncbi:HutD family protein [Nocardioides sp. IC4_145]|uniref:HutD/Ves family protein n=1 Tax=Nocardioides sp. IC4_145 TaxID=2714037 RepID=UPI0014092C83|nr:HutD family protein [Nocardioides sp. IC4_145]NHC24333.1 HutD family protein [Nocardioides sp. IC4_145]